MAQTVDYIVVGAGSAGAVVASRLSERGDRSVLLLEAGPADRKKEIRIPAAFAKLYRTELDWSYDTVPQPQLANRSIFWPRGRMLGGSSSMNAMMWVRGYAADYNRWAELASPDWSYRDLLPYFRRIESVAGSTHPEHGRDGTIRIERQRSPRSHTRTMLAAADEAGLGLAEANSAQPDGFVETRVSQHRGSRFSTARAYLRPARHRRNLETRTNAQVTRVVFDGHRATGVEYVVDGTTHIASARRQIILSGGAVNTPQLLMLSGIGGGDLLKRHGIEVLVDAPEVGRNLLDHLVAGLIREVREDTLFTAETPRQLADYLLRRRGMLTSNVGEAYGFVRSRDDLPLPDLELIFAPVAFWAEGLIPPPRHGVTIAPILVQPLSSGTIVLASADPLAKPIIDPAYLSDPAGADRAAMMAGLELADKLFATGAFQGVVGDYIVPEGGDAMSPDERYTTALEQHGHTLYHPVGTCRMGADNASVVDPTLRVRGVQNLMVADASIMPTIIRGHTNAPSILIGEKAVDLIPA